MRAYMLSSAGFLLSCLVFTSVLADTRNHYEKVKSAQLKDPTTGDFYQVVSFNVTSMTTTSTHRSVIKVFRSKANEITSREPENIQTINFHPTLVDFILDCLPTHCYMVAITSRNKKNLELYSWQRTQFDLLAKRDTFARPRGVELFSIQNGFYIAVAQDQLHLAPTEVTFEHDESNRFIGCVIFKFVQGHEKNLRYHQFIRLQFDPKYVSHYVSAVSQDSSLNSGMSENHYLVFSVEKHWRDANPIQASIFIWSPLDEIFWPFKLPRATIVEKRPGIRYPVFRFPDVPKSLNLTTLSVSQQAESVESCFNQLERLLVDRDFGARKLIDSSKTLWRSQHNNQPNKLSSDITEIKAQVIVHGNVIVGGSILENPHITVVGASPPAVRPRTLGFGEDLSPTVIDYRIKQAFYKLNHIRGKLSQAVIANSLNDTIINSQVNFFGLIGAEKVSFPNGISNPNVKINRVPFKRLENELISLRGSQNIAEKVIFQGKVVADMLEVHGIINNEYYLKDAVDITSKRVQVIDLLGQIGRPGYSPLHFVSVSAPELIMSHNATINDIRLDDFITRDERTQYVFGRKNFNVITTQQLKLAHPDILLMGHNITKMAEEAIRLRNPYGKNTQVLNGDYQMFHNTVRTNRLIINNMVNHQINVTTLIHDSVKTYDINGQKINGRKNFKAGLRIAHLETDGALNGIQVNQIFNLNPEPPLTNNIRMLNASQIPITGNFIFQNVVTVRGNLNAALVNGIDLSRYAVRRSPKEAIYNNSVQPQLVSGLKIFNKPLRILNGFHLLDHKQIAELPVRRPVQPPLIDGISIKNLTDSLAHLVQNPPPMYIDNLVIDGNLYLDTARSPTGTPRVTLGGNSDCPIHILPKKLILAGDDQIIDTPIRIDSLRAKYVTLDPGALNGYSFPQDFVLKSVRGNSSYEPVFGAKSIERLIIGPSTPSTNFHYKLNHHKLASSHLGQQVIVGERSTINDIPYNELRTFVEHERQKNLTGEAAYQTLNVYGNIFARRINGHRWPDDILLKSTSSNAHLVPPAYKRIYSPIIFLNTSNLTVNNQLVLRGPFQLDGLMNGVNLSEFARDSVTYGDKDLLSAGRPIRNKIFLGGITVMNEIRSYGLINNLSISDLARKVVTIGPRDKTFHITGQKAFMSDINFLGPLNVAYLNDIPLTQQLQKVQLQEGNRILIRGKKFISGNLKINRDLIVQGLVNKIDFIELNAHSIPLRSKGNELKFNKTLTVEGDVFMDNLLIDENNGIIDGVKLTNLLPVEAPNKNELILSAPRIFPSGSSDGRNFKLLASINDCQITCNLERTGTNYSLVAPMRYERLQPLPIQQPTMVYPIRPIFYNGRNVSLMRTTPPYVTDYTPPIPQMRTRYKRQTLDRSRIIHGLAMRQPISILYERHVPQRANFNQVESPLIEAQLEEIRKQMISLNFARHKNQQNIVVGFIDSTSNDISQLHLPEQADHHLGHIETPHSFLLLDQIDYPFKPTTFHMSVGVFTDRQGENVTSVYFSLGGGESRQLSVLPVEYPNSAMFLRIADQQTLFLLVSQDYTSASGPNRGNQCPRLLFTEPRLTYEANSCRSNSIQYPKLGVHVYLFHALQNSSSLKSAYFDLFQTIDLPPIDSFESFSYEGSTYAIAVSRYTSQVYLLLLRGYSGFELVSYEHAPMIESIKLLYNAQMKPILMIRQTNGVDRLMESVII